MRGSTYLIGSRQGRDPLQDLPLTDPDRARARLTDQETWRRLVSAGIALSSELSLDDLLHRLVETAADLTGARYAAIGVVDESHTMLDRFITTGIDEETRARIGDLPTGRGILGVLIREARPLRLGDISEDPRSIGFPPGHPPMRTFLGVPIQMRGVAYGNLYLTEKSDGAEFTEEDEDLAELLAAQAAVAIDNARMYASATSWMRQMETLLDVSRRLATEIDQEVALRTLCDESRRLVHAEVAIIALTTESGDVRIRAISGDDPERFTRATLSLEDTKLGRILRRGRAERIDSILDDPEADQRQARELGIRSALMAPMHVGGAAVGALVTFNCQGGRFSDGDLRLVELFAERAAQAIDLSRRVTRQSLARAVQGQEQERRLLGSALHDEAAQALALILMGIRSTESASDDAERVSALAHLEEVATTALESVRRLSHQLHPPTLERHGLGSAIQMLADQMSGPGLEINAESSLSGRLDPDVETSLFRMVQEALANVVKHANATHASVLVARRDRGVVVIVEDDGVGFDTRTLRGDTLGLLAMRERLELLGGTLQVDSEPGRGTTVRAVIARVRMSGDPTP